MIFASKNLRSITNFIFIAFTLYLFPGLTESSPGSKTKKDEFVFNNDAEPETLDPHRASGVYANNILIQIFEGLMARGADWESLLPGQAERYEVSEDQKTYTFFLRKNLKWSDGSALTSRDFVYSWLRSMRPSTLNDLSYWLVDNIENAKQYADNPNAETAKKVGLRALDDYTFEVKLNKPLAYFLQLTALAALFPVKETIVEKHADRWFRPEHIVSNGPYVLKEWKVNQRIVLETNPHYYDSEKLKIKRIVAFPIADKQVAVNMFEQGSLDWTGLTGAPHQLVHAYRNKAGFRVNPGFVAYFFRFNTMREPLNDKRIRQALSLAINRKEIVEKITRAGEKAAPHFVPQGIKNYSSPKTLVSGQYKDDLKRAKRLLAEAGYPQGKGLRKIRINYNTDENNKRVALAIQQMWQSGLGIDVEILNQEWKVHLQTQQSLDYDISRNGWAGYYPDPSAFLEVFTSSSNVNQTGWKNLEYDKNFFEANSLPSGLRRMKKLQRAEQILLEEAVIAPIYTYSNFSFLNPQLKGFPANKPDRPFVKYFSKN